MTHLFEPKMNLKLRQKDFVFNDQKKIGSNDLEVTSDPSTCSFFSPTAPSLGWILFPKKSDWQRRHTRVDRYIFWCCNFFMIFCLDVDKNPRVFSFYMYFLLCYRPWKTPQPIPPHETKTMGDFRGYSFAKFWWCFNRHRQNRGYLQITRSWHVNSHRSSVTSASC